MKPSIEPPGFERTRQSLTAFVRRERTFEWNWHHHPEFELTWIRRGHGRRLIGSQAVAYGAGELVLLGAHLPHTWISDADSRQNEAVVIQFREFPPELLTRPEFSVVADLLRRAGGGVQFQDVEGLVGRLPGLTKLLGLSAWLGLVDFLSRLGVHSGAVSLSAATEPRRRVPPFVSRLEEVTNYIEDHFRAPLPLSEVARVAGLTPNGFSRLFRRMTNQTFVSYRNARRIREVCCFLSEADASIIRIAGECGFENLANFNRQFRQEMAMTPREYRRLHTRPSLE